MVIVAPRAGRAASHSPDVLQQGSDHACTYESQVLSRASWRSVVLSHFFIFVNSLLFCLLRVAESDSPLYKMEEHRFSLTAALKDVRRYVAGQYMIPPHKVRSIGLLSTRSTSLGLY